MAEFGTQEYYKEKIEENSDLLGMLLYALKGAVNDTYVSSSYVEKICIKIAKVREAIDYAKSKIEKEG